MKIEIPDHEDSTHIKNLVTMAFDKPERTNLLAFVTDKGSYVIMKLDKEAKLQRYICKQYFEEILMNKGETGCRIDFNAMLKEIERGD